MKASTTLAAACQQAKEFILSSRTPYLIGVGNTSPWLVEGNPPEVDPTTFTQRELICYFPIKTCRPIYQHPQGNLQIQNRKYFIQESLDIYEMAIANATDVLIEAEIHHNDLNYSSYRSVGLYTHIVFSNNIAEINSRTTRIEKSDVISAILDTLIHYPAVEVQNNFVHKLQIVRSFY